MREERSSDIIGERWSGMSLRMHQSKRPSEFWLAPLVDALREHPSIGQLFPFTSLDTLCLSRTTRYPWSGDCPHIDAIAENLFRVYGTKYIVVVKTYQEHQWREAEYDILGEGGVPEAIAWIDAALPINCGRAIEGNFDDLRRAEGKSVPSAETRALLEAAALGKIDEVADLLNAGVDVNGSEYDGATALMMAALAGREAVVRLLLDRGANVNARLEDGETALDRAIFLDKHPGVIQMLQQAIMESRAGD